MIGALVLAVVQGVAGDTSAFANSVTTRGPYQVRLELQRPAYVTVVRVWPEEVQLQASHGFRLAAGTRYVTWLATDAAGRANDVGIGGGLSQYPSRVNQRACEAVAGTGRPVDAASPNYAPRVAPPAPPCRSPEPLSNTGWNGFPASQTLPAHRVLVIVSESQPDRAALSRAIDSLHTSLPDLPSIARSLLAGYRGAWAAYVAQVH